MAQSKSKFQSTMREWERKQTDDSIGVAPMWFDGASTTTFDIESDFQRDCDGAQRVNSIVFESRLPPDQSHINATTSVSEAWWQLQTPLKTLKNLKSWNIYCRWTMTSIISTQSSAVRIYCAHPVHPEPPPRNARAATHAQYQQTTLWLPLRRGPKQYTGNRIYSACVHSQCVWQRHIGIRHGIEYMIHFHISNA